MRSLKKLVGGFLLSGELGRTIGSAALGGDISLRTETASMPPVPTNSTVGKFTWQSYRAVKIYSTFYYLLQGCNTIVREIIFTVYEIVTWSDDT